MTNLSSLTPDFPHISIVIPVYKAEECIRELYRRLTKVLEEMAVTYEILLVEDFGGDQSWNIIEELSVQDSRVRGFQFCRNFGQHYGITAGLDHCRGDWVVVMDCDLQDRPEEIPRLYQKALEGHEVVLALRGKRSDPLIKKLASKIFYILFSYLSDMKYDGDTGNFRIMSRKVVQNFCLMREQLRFFGGLMHWMGFASASVEVQHAQRYAGQSSYTLKKLVSLATQTVIAYSDKPLKLAVQMGFMMALLAIFFGIYILSRAILFGSAVAGWSSLIVVLFFLGGIIITILGIIGIYLGKTFDETKNRPLYIIGKMTSQVNKS
jgi:glycosyltransferase involved in cell wall biosynthesis